MLDVTPPSLSRDGVGSAEAGPRGNLMPGGLALARGGAASTKICGQDMAGWRKIGLSPFLDETRECNLAGFSGRSWSGSLERER